MTDAARFCTYCGAPLVAGAAFCQQCGRPVAGRSTPEQPATEATRVIRRRPPVSITAGNMFLGLIVTLVILGQFMLTLLTLGIIGFAVFPATWKPWPGIIGRFFAGVVVAPLGLTMLGVGIGYMTQTDWGLGSWFSILGLLMALVGFALLWWSWASAEAAPKP